MNKFFKSKIDFTAPIKSLQLQQNMDPNAIQNNLSDDSGDAAYTPNIML